MNDDETPAIIVRTALGVLAALAFVAVWILVEKFAGG